MSVVKSKEKDFFEYILIITGTDNIIQEEHKKYVE